MDKVLGHLAPRTRKVVSAGNSKKWKIIIKNIFSNNYLS